MDFTRRSKIVKELDSLAEQYPHVLLLYKQPPTGDISLEEFEELAFDRLQVLRILEQAGQMGHKLYSTEWKQAVIGYLRKQGLRKYVRLIESTGCNKQTDADTQSRREDYLSHFILRLAYCRSEDLRNWFMARELELFKMRFLNLSVDGVKTFITANNLDYAPISAEEKDKIKNGLIQSTTGYSPVQVESTDFYKVPFVQVTDLIRNTSVYINKGYAYIPTGELVSCISSWLRTHLKDALMYAGKRLPSLDDERITGLLAMLHASYTGKDYSNTPNTDSSLTAVNIHSVVRKSFPLCMKSLYDILRNTHHLKHFGRLQFGLFLKGIGLSLDEAIKFWRTEFCKSIDGETFNKKYLYNIKHSYGKLGKMTSYTPFGCKKIISENPGAGEHHGCPFKLWDSEMLKQKMLEYGVSADGTREVAEIAAKGNYQIACSKYFIYTHGGIESKQIINHPNQYFDESQEILKPSTSSNQNSMKTRRHPESSQSSTQISQDQNRSQINDDSIFDDDLDLSQINEEAMGIN